MDFLHNMRYGFILIGIRQKHGFYKKVNDVNSFDLHHGEGVKFTVAEIRHS